MAGTSKPGIIRRMYEASLHIIGKDTPTWMDPGNPLPSVVGNPAAVEGRQFDFQPNVNALTTPKSESFANRSVMFPELRWMADQVEILRLVIETTKDQVCAMNWDFRVVGSKDKQDPRAAWLREFFKRPDGIHDMRTWVRMLMEDLLVIDAPTLHVIRDRQNPELILGFEQVDGATIKPLMDEWGRLPQGFDANGRPFAAYAQVLKGMQATHYSTLDLVYKPRNPRIHSVYGYGPVEQIMTYANTAIRRQLQQLGFFTEGNMPEGFVPVQGTADQVQKFQRIWDAGEIDGQKVGRVRFIPADTASKFVPFKDAVLADAFDEWMARIVCYSFSQEPTPFVKQVNRATAETARDQSLKEGVAVRIQWIKDLLDDLIQNYLDLPGCEAFVSPSQETDPLKLGKYVEGLTQGANPIMRIDEARDLLGLEGDAPTPPASSAQDVPAVAPPTDPQNVAHVHRAAKVLDTQASRTLAMRHETAIADSVFGYFQQTAQRAAREIDKSLHRVQRGESDTFNPDTFDFREIDFLRAVGPSIENVYAGSAHIAIESTGAPIKLGFKEESAAWAKERGAWLVGKSVNESGELVESVRPEYRVSEQCREAIRSVIAQAAEENWTAPKITETLQNDHAFSRARAQTIAQTEIVNADEQGKLAGWKASGVKLQKRSLLGANENHGINDIENAAQGWIPVEKSFQSGDESPPYHPNCIPEGQRVAWAGKILAATKSLYRGLVVEITLGTGNRLTVTENHPVLTASGWKRAKLLNQGEEVFLPAGCNRSMEGGPNDDNFDPLIEQVFSSLQVAGGMSSTCMPTSAEDFHGDAVGFQEDVQVVNVDGFLMGDIFPGKPIQNNKFEWASRSLCGFFANRSSDLSLQWELDTPNGVMSSFGVGSPLLRSESAISEKHSGSAISGRDSLTQQSGSNHITGNIETQGDRKFGFPSEITTTNIVAIQVREFSGHVYDLQVEHQIYTCSGVAVHNCYCTTVARSVKP